MFEVAEVVGGEYIESVRTLLREYAVQMSDDEFTDAKLWRQNIDRELRELPQGYLPPDGCLLIGLCEGVPAGCVALKKLDDDACEMRRMFVKPEFRNRRLGRILAEKIIEKARDLGYARMRLDTLPSMQRAQSLYSALGFRPIAPYNDDPLKDAVFMELVL